MNFSNMKHLTRGGNNIVRLSHCGNIVWKGLPEGYKQLDYIETTGTQYIDTGFIPNQDSRIVCEFMFFSGSGIYGARNTTQSNNFDLRVTNGEWQPGYGDTISGTTKYDTTNWHVADQKKNVFALDGTVRRTFTYETFTTPYPAVLGGIMANKNGVKTLYGGSGRYRTCQIYDNGVLVRDFIPCKDPDGNIGMYDMLNAKFYVNSGTGTFVAGAEV